jgi:hypothetical protein
VALARRRTVGKEAAGARTAETELTALARDGREHLDLQGFIVVQRFS